MIHGVQNNALAEIALALAMGFFSIMVLTLVSMGSGLSPAQSTDSAHSPGVLVQPSEPSQSQDQSKTETTETMVSSADLVIYHAGRYLNADLKPIDPASLSGRSQIVLAVDGALPMAEALKAREGVPVKNLTIAPLDARWQRALKENQL